MERLIWALKADKIRVYEPSEVTYERSVATANLLYRFARPDLVVQPRTPEQVQTIVEQAKTYDMALTIKCGGHSYAGHSTAAEGISLDLSRMKKVDLDMDSLTVTIGGGCQWAHVYKTLIDGRHDGYIINGGRCPSVGVGGFLLGGGLGPFSRTFGMGSDTIKEITIVTADSELVTVSETDSRTSDKGRLFWALRGAGGGNFGVVVEMKLAVKKLRSPVVVAGRFEWYATEGDPDLYSQDRFISTMNAFYTADWPRRITIDSTWLCDLTRNVGNGVRFLVYFDGDKDDFDATIDKYIEDPELAKQLKRRALPERSTRFFHESLVAQWSEETVKAFPKPENSMYSIYSSFVFQSDRSTLSKVTVLLKELSVAFRKEFSGEKVQFFASFIHCGGKTRSPKPDDSAYVWRKAVYHMYVTIDWVDKWMERDMREFLGRIKKRLRPLSFQREAAFANFPDGALSTKLHERAYWGDNWEELRRVKQIWDEENFFNSRQGVQLPSADESVGRIRRTRLYSVDDGEKPLAPFIPQRGVQLPSADESVGRIRRTRPFSIDDGEKPFTSSNPRQDVQTPSVDESVGRIRRTRLTKFDTGESKESNSPFVQFSMNTSIAMHAPEEASDEDEDVYQDGDEELTDILASGQWSKYRAPDLEGDLED